ncbi:MAG TPA: hypothetical protein VHL11_01060 [Phototrophicaceae bacterium]|nr:hypothetical protein [Phototrophicaceae bacterium]
MSDPVPSPRDFRPELPQAVEKVLFKALAKAPEDRYSTGKTLAEALENALLARSPKTLSAVKSASIAERVAIELDANPLPPIPAVIGAVPQPNETPSTRVKDRKLASTIPVQSRSRLPIYVGIGVGAALVLILILVVIRGANNSATDPTESVAVVENPTSTDTDVPTATIQSIDTPLPPPTATATLQPTFTQVLSPTSEPTIEPTSQPTSSSSNNQASVPQVSLLTDGRGLTTGTHMTNGEIEVEGYCTRLNSNYTVTEDGANWYCVENGQHAVTLTEADFTEICRLTYNQSDAFAIQAQGTLPAAYRWRCFGEINTTNESSYTIVIRWRKEDSLFVTNEGTAAFPLNGFSLAGNGQLIGTEWGLIPSPAENALLFGRIQADQKRQIMSVPRWVIMLPVMVPSVSGNRISGYFTIKSKSPPAIIILVPFKFNKKAEMDLLGLEPRTN